VGLRDKENGYGAKALLAKKERSKSIDKREFGRMELSRVDDSDDGSVDMIKAASIFGLCRTR